MEITARTGPYKTRMRNRKIRHEALIYSSNQSSKYSFMNHPTGTIKNSEIVTPHGSTLFWAADDWRLHKDTSLTFRTVVVVPFPWFLRLAHWNGIFQHCVIPVVKRTNSSWRKTIYSFTISHIQQQQQQHSLFYMFLQNIQVLYSSNRNLNMESRHLSSFVGDIIVLVNW